MPFNILLTNLMVDVPEAVGAIFLDEDGETVDFVTRHGEPFDLKVEGAIQGLFTRHLVSTFTSAGIGSLEYFMIEGSELATLTHVLPDSYYVVLVVRKPVARARAQHHLTETAKMIAREFESPAPIESTRASKRENNKPPPMAADGTRETRWLDHS
jgi:hypothetical protein